MNADLEHDLMARKVRLLEKQIALLREQEQLDVEIHASEMERILELPDKFIEPKTGIEPNVKIERNLYAYYVYVWFDGEVPFYVGKGIGQGGRYYMSHGGQLCEELRKHAVRFSISVLDHLTELGALALEGAMIKLLKPKGNVQHGRRVKKMISLEEAWKSVFEATRNDENDENDENAT